MYFLAIIYIIKIIKQIRIMKVKTVVWSSKTFKHEIKISDNNHFNHMYKPCLRKYNSFIVISRKSFCL